MHDSALTKVKAKARTEREEGKEIKDTEKEEISPGSQEVRDSEKEMDEREP